MLSLNLRIPFDSFPLCACVCVNTCTRLCMCLGVIKENAMFLA